MTDALAIAEGSTFRPAPNAPVQHASVAERVTLFEDRAEVVRSARVPVVAGPQWVQLSGITPFCDDRSLEASAQAPVKVLTQRLVRRVVEEPVATPSEVTELENALKQARRRMSDASLEMAREQATAVRVDALHSQWTAMLAQQPRGLAEAPVADEFRKSWQLARDERAKTHERIATLRAALQAAEDDARSYEQRLAQARLTRPRQETIVEVQVDAPEATEAAIELKYRTPCALWRPEHLARLSWDGAGPGQVEITTFATAWQATGERWENVRIRFSTARPAKEATPPLITDDWLSLRKKTAEEMKRIVVEARDQVIQAAGVAGTRAVDEMPGVDDGGEPLNFEPSERVSLSSDGRPFRVEVGRRKLAAEVARVAYPERTAAPHLRATGILTEGGPLLAGPIRVARDRALVGRSRTDFVGLGERFELGFGPDDGVRVRREIDEERETATLTGTQTVKRTVTLYLSNLSGQARKLDVVERLPVSEIEDLSVSPAQPKEWAQDKDGFARQTLELAPGATKTLTLKYEIKAGSKVLLPF